MSTQLTKKDAEITYTRKYTVTPYCLRVFPFDLDRFCTVILSPPNDPLLPGLLKLVLNSYCNPVIISASSEYEASTKFTKTDEKDIRSRVAIIDLSGTFSNIHPDITPFDSSTPDWVRKHYYFNTIMPNRLVQDDKADGAWSKNYSHTVFLAQDFDDIPKVVLTNAHLTYCTSHALIVAFLKKKLGIELEGLDTNIVLAITSTICSNIEVMTIPGKRLLV